ERVAAFFCEPVIGAGGVFPPPPGYLDAARQVCAETGVLFVADEVITGFARCGDWFASDALVARAGPRDLRQRHHQRLPAPRRGAGCPPDR
ncbi:MAG TPA: aminotransferase class III-fold pyridoxal phosphate-dependent enzyme, partial [Actinomycetota bacterium]|nr:aminotransferase class III-fold pyridoxal phosphate-dependent enzyme [Actinomycetota bacterium]